MSNPPTVVSLGLAGGQGKSTVALMLGRYLGRLGIPVLFVDCDPQSSLTSFLGVQVQPHTPTLLEVLTQPEEKTKLSMPLHLYLTLNWATVPSAIPTCS